jgi:hypothetical protein
VVDDEWRLSAVLRDEIALDLWIVMPNHVHGVVIIETIYGGDRPVAPTTLTNIERAGNETPSPRVEPA